MFNKVVLIGNLTRDIELRYTQSGSAIGNTGVATTRKFTANGERKEEVCFIDVTFFGRSAEVANQYLRKGSKVLIEGRLSFDQWTAQDGSKRSKHSIIVESMQMMDTKQDSGSQQEDYNHQQRKHTDYQPRQQMPDKNALPGIDIDDDEIPF